MRSLIRQPVRRLGAMAGVCLGLSGLFAGAVHAQVIDVRPDGSMAAYAGPVTASPEGVRPILFAPIISRPAQPPAGLQAAIRSAAARHRLSEQLVAAVARQESGFRQDAVSPRGARGVMQLMPQTASAIGVDAARLEDNLDGGSAYLALLLNRFDGDIIKTLAAYNAGPEAVARYNGVPPYPETRAYVAAILDRLAAAPSARKAQP